MAMASPLLQHAFRQEQLYLVLYLDQEHDGARQNQRRVLKPSGKGLFGVTVVNDWPIYEGPDPCKATMVAHARGHHMQTGKDERGSWFLSCSIVFLDGSWYVCFVCTVTTIHGSEPPCCFCTTCALFGYTKNNFVHQLIVACMRQATRVPRLS